MSGFACQECGHKFRTIAAVERAMSVGCPKCGASAIDAAFPEAPVIDAKHAKAVR